MESTPEVVQNMDEEELQRLHDEVHSTGQLDELSQEDEDRIKRSYQDFADKYLNCTPADFVRRVRPVLTHKNQMQMLFMALSAYYMNYEQSILMVLKTRPKERLDELPDKIKEVMEDRQAHFENLKEIKAMRECINERKHLYLLLANGFLVENPDKAEAFEAYADDMVQRVEEIKRKVSEKSQFAEQAPAVKEQ